MAPSDPVAHLHPSAIVSPSLLNWIFPGMIGTWGDFQSGKLSAVVSNWRPSFTSQLQAWEVQSTQFKTQGGTHKSFFWAVHPRFGRLKPPLSSFFQSPKTAPIPLAEATPSPKAKVLRHWSHHPDGVAHVGLFAGDLEENLRRDGDRRRHGEASRSVASGGCGTAGKGWLEKPKEKNPGRFRHDSRMFDDCLELKFVFGMGNSQKLWQNRIGGSWAMASLNSLVISMCLTSSWRHAHAQLPNRLPTGSHPLQKKKHRTWHASEPNRCLKIFKLFKLYIIYI